MNFNNLRNKEKSLILRQNFRYWKMSSLENSGYFIIFQGFEEGNKLKNISGNGLKLYIYLGLHANNYEGIVWHSNKTIAKYFGKSERTIRGWMKELEELQLIKRMRLKYDGNVYTYLQPYISKYNNEADNEGILYFNDLQQLCFQSRFKSKVLNDKEYNIILFMANDFTIENPIKGKLIKKSDDDYFENKEFIFESSDGTIKLLLESNMSLDMIFKVILED